MNALFKRFQTLGFTYIGHIGHIGQAMMSIDNPFLGFLRVVQTWPLGAATHVTLPYPVKALEQRATALQVSLHNIKVSISCVLSSPVSFLSRVT